MQHRLIKTITKDGSQYFNIQYRSWGTFWFWVDDYGEMADIMPNTEDEGLKVLKRFVKWRGNKKYVIEIV